MPPSSSQPDYEAEFLELWKKVEPFTMTSQARGYALWTAVNRVIDNKIPGAFVECGVWRGGSSMLIAQTLLQRGIRDRLIFLFDTFDGMSEPSEEDVDIHGHHARDLMAGSAGNRIAELVTARADLEQVRERMKSTGYDMRFCKFVQGDVQETLSKTQTLRISLLRLDTDFYASTLAELRELYPRLSRGGILIIDDYGHWQGAKQACEEYFDDPSNKFSRPMLWAIDYTGRGGVKVEDVAKVEIDRYDYIPPGMSVPDLLHLFPFATTENPWAVKWPYLRPQTPHNWRSDSRNMGYVTGNASVEEAACLYTYASQFRGQRGLEIGTHFGWTAAHLLAAGLELDCIDPRLDEPERYRQVAEVLDEVEGGVGYRLFGGTSPDTVGLVREAAEAPWSFVFIDGDHGGDAPLRDAAEAVKHLANDAMVVFHDMVSPHVAAGLAFLQDEGFSVRLINTMQILGVAWRGNVVPPEHVPDFNTPLVWHGHLERFL